jgi:hypothetical protein
MPLGDVTEENEIDMNMVHHPKVINKSRAVLATTGLSQETT